jgi:hypothetical protein
MLGLGRASEYAGWWNNKLTTIRFSGSGATSSLQQQSPEYSYLSSPTSGGSITTTGSFNITGLSGFTGYNTRRSTHFYHCYLPSSSWTGLSSNAYFGMVNTLAISGTNYFYNASLGVGSGGQLTFNWQSGGPTNTITMPNNYTTYRDTWLTFIGSSSETYTSFTNWTGPTSGTNVNYSRMAVYDTQTGTLLSSVDFTTTQTPPSLGSLPSSLPSTGSTSLSSNDYTSNGISTRKAAHWCTIGQMFDPFTLTDTSWFTPSPSATLGGAKAWLNVRYLQNTTSSGIYYVPTDSQDLYSEPSNLKWRFGNSNTYWSTNSSTSIIVRNN